MRCYIGMDVGGTTARMRLTDADSRVLCDREGPGGTVSSSGAEEMRRRFADLLLPALGAHGLAPDDCAGLTIGASGVDSERLRAVYTDLLADLGFPRGCLSVHNDCELLLDLMDGPGVVLIAGTGAIAMGRRGPGAPLERCGGWEHLLSDRGGAASIGLEVLREAVRCWDGLEEAPVLLRLLREETGLEDPDAAVAWTAEHILDKERLAALALLAAKAADAGEPAALALLDRAAAELAALAAAVVRRVSDGACSVLLWGSVLMKNARVRREVLRLMRAECPRARLFLPAVSALEAAALLAAGRKPEGLIPAED